MKCVCLFLLLHLVLPAKTFFTSSLLSDLIRREEEPVARTGESFSTPVDEVEVFSTQDKTFNQISADVFQNLSSVFDLKSVLALLRIQEKPPLSFSRLRLKTTDERLLLNPQQAHCEPEMESVDLRLRNTDAVAYYPTCIRVKRCESKGCCERRETSCQPTASQRVVVKVLKLIPETTENKLRLTRGRRNRRRKSTLRVQHNFINVIVEEHTNCSCRCTLQENECDLSVHTYDEQSCGCICKNKDEAEKCSQRSTHVWHNKTCQCLCKEAFSCSSSQVVNHKTCSCSSPELEVNFNDLFHR